MTTATSALARETVAYAAHCLRAGEKALALDAIHSEASGLKPEYQQDIEQVIKDLGDESSPSELNLAEDRIIGVVQPEMWEFMQNEKLVAQALSFFGSLAEVQNAALGLTPSSHFRVAQWHLRVQALDAREVHFNDLWKAYTHNPFREMDDPEDTLTWFDMLSYFHHVKTIRVNDPPSQKCYSSQFIRNYDDFLAIYEESHPGFERPTFHITSDASGIWVYHLNNIITKLIWEPNTSRIEMYDLNNWTMLPYLKELTLIGELAEEIYDPPQNLFKEFKRLEKLTVRCSSEMTRFIALRDELKKLKLKSLVLSRCHINSEKILLLAELPHLEELDISGCESNISSEDISNFKRAKQGVPIKKIIRK